MMLPIRSEQSWNARLFIFFVLAALLPNASWAQLSGVIMPSGLIATTLDQVPGMPEGVTFFDDGYLCCAGLGKPLLSQGSKVAFAGLPDAPLVGGVFLGGGGMGLANATPPGPGTPPVNVPFSVWAYTGPGRVVLDGSRVAFGGTRYDLLCDENLSCFQTQVDGIVGYMQGGFEPDFLVEGLPTHPRHVQIRDHHLERGDLELLLKSA